MTHCTHGEVFRFGTDYAFDIGAIVAFRFVYVAAACAQVLHERNESWVCGYGEDDLHAHDASHREDIALATLHQLAALGCPIAPRILAGEAGWT